jgi:hypothetical protein
MLSDAGIQGIRECGSNVERNRVGKQNQKGQFDTSEITGRVVMILQVWKAALAA